MGGEYARGQCRPCVPNCGADCGQLAQQIRTEFPTWTPEGDGARNLRDFIERSVGGVGVVGRSGLDVIYGPAVEPAMQEPTVAEQDVNLWRVWVSPNSPLVLSIATESANVTGVPRSWSPRKGWARIEPAPHEVHEEIAREFAQSLGARQEHLEVIVGRAAGWWRDWQSELRGLGLDSAWLEFRSGALEARLRTALEGHLTGNLIERAMGQVVGDRSRVRQTSVLRTESQRRSRSDLEQILLLAIRRMDVSDLRDLKIPVGVLLDVLDGRSSPT